jgi:predicted O-methyltransferase YrrM
MENRTLVRIKASVLRKFGYNLDHGHTWEKLSFQYADADLNRYLYDFIVKLFPIFIQSENKLLISRAKNADQIADATSELGNHYRLLFSLAKLLNAKKVLEIGTYTGMSAISFLDTGCQVKSFDVVSSLNFKHNVILEEDLGTDKIQLICGDLYNDEFFSQNINNFLEADIIFLDGPKFGGFEQKLLPKILDLNFYKNTIVVVDDIHMKKMKILWYELNYPRLDLSLIGHVSGTGVIFPKLKKMNVPADNHK